MNWRFYPEDSDDGGYGHWMQRIVDWWIGARNDEEEWSELTLDDFRWNEHDDISGQEIAHYIAMHYELYNERVLKYFAARDRMDQLLVLNVDELDAERMWTEIMTFLQCGNEDVVHIEYPHLNPTQHTFTEIELFPENHTLDWKRFFEHRIPIMMAEHKPHRRIWIEYQDGDWTDLL